MRWLLIYNRAYPTKWIKVALGAHFVNDTSSDAQLTKTIVRIKIHEDYNGTELVSVLCRLQFNAADVPVNYPLIYNNGDAIVKQIRPTTSPS